MSNSEIERLRKDNARLERAINLYRKEHRLLAGGVTLLILGPRLVVSFRTWLAALLTEQSLPIDETADLAAAITRRFISAGLIGLLFALVPSLLLWQQNRLFKDLTEQANILTGVQNTLIEAETGEVRLQRELARIDLLSRQEQAVSDFVDRLRRAPRHSNSLQGSAHNVYPPRASADCVPIMREDYPELRNLARTLEPVPGEKSTARARLLADLIELPACELQPHGTEFWVSGMGARYGSEEFGDLASPLTFLQHVQLDNADFSGLDLSFARLRLLAATNSRFDGTSFLGSDLTLADLRGSSFDGAHFGVAKLQSTQLQGADLRSAIAFLEPLPQELDRPVLDSTTQLPAYLDGFPQAAVK